jgi:iron complex outermembrane recepter protein
MTKLILLLPLAFAFPAWAQQPLDEPVDQGTAEVERVIVTGSNIPTAEEVGPEPVDTYQREDIQNLGVRTATDLVQKLPAITGAAINQNGGNNGDGRTEVNLRGLFPKETLFLVDGKRVAPVGFVQGASVDLNLIPFSLVDHIDILKDGASAIYGSDAIAGVFNVILKHKFRGVEIGSSYGNSNLGASNDMAERDAYLLAGIGDKKTDIVVYAEYYDRDSIFSHDRDISSTADFRRFGGPNSNTSTFPGRVDGYLLRPGLLTPAPHSAPDVTTSPDYLPISSLPRSERTFNFASLTASVPEADRQYFYGSLNRDIFDKSLIVFADFKYARSFFGTVLAPVPISRDPFTRADGVNPFSLSGISVPLSNPFNPFTTADAFLPDGTPVTTGVRYRELSAGGRTFNRTTNDYLVDAGIRGNLSEIGKFFQNWNYELSFRYNSNDHEEVSGGVVSKPALRAALLDTNPATAFNPFGRNVNTEAALSRIFVTLHHDGIAKLYDGIFSLNGDLITLPAGPVSFAIGSEYRQESVDDRPDALTASFNTIGAINVEPSRGNRDAWSYYGELRVPVTSPLWNVPGLHSVELGFAERIEYYSDFGDAEKPKFSIRYQPFDSSLTLRATYTEAFHAPNLSDLSTSLQEGLSQVGDPAFPNSDAVIVRLLSGGQPNLRPEVAYGWNYGAVYSPTFIKGLTLSVDFYHIDLRDRTNFLDPQFIVDQNFSSGGRQFPGQVVRDPVTGEIVEIIDRIQNISRTITEGIDYQAIYTFDTSVFGRGNFGTFTFTLNGNYLSRYVAAINLGGKEFEYAGQESGFAGYLPHHRLYTSLFYELGGLEAGAIVRYISQGGEIFFNNNNFEMTSRKIREWTTLDLLFSYTFKNASPLANDTSPATGKDKEAISTASYKARGWRAWLSGTTITVGINNVFDQDPPFVASAFENGFDESAFDEKGRFWYVALKKRF